MSKLSVRDLRPGGSRVFVRVDYNVPLTETGGVGDDARVRASLPTLEQLRDAGAKLVLASHLGRPKGGRDDSLSLRPVAVVLGDLLGTEVRMASDCIGDDVADAARSLEAGEVLLLENLRFHAGETANDPDFARSLASLADLYVNDAFGSSHRAHASVAGVPPLMPRAAAGLLLERETRALGRLLGDDVRRPYVAVLGGAKVGDKIPLLENLLPRVDTVIIGGAMAYTFLAAGGTPIGASRLDRESLEVAGRILETAASRGVQLELPGDHVVAEAGRTEGPGRTCGGASIDEGWQGLDIGPGTAERFAGIVSGAGTVLWNGPMGLFEIPPFDRGTRELARAIAASPAYSVVGGGDSAAAVRSFGLADRFDHVSTGGGAALEFLSGVTLPGVAALTDA
ncbi:MAG: phosphoglycerate kinase [Acidobacteriota bacterium]